GSHNVALSFPVAGGPVIVAVADLNHDNKADLVTANFFASSVSVLLSTGTLPGLFPTHTEFALGDNPIGVRVGDLDGDGKPDVIAAVRSTNLVGVALGHGDGTFAEAQFFVAGTHPLGVTVGDFNGDGKLDVATANDADANLSVLLGNGDGTL